MDFLYGMLIVLIVPAALVYGLFAEWQSNRRTQKQRAKYRAMIEEGAQQYAARCAKESRTATENAPDAHATPGAMSENPGSGKDFPPHEKLPAPARNFAPAKNPPP